MSGSDLSHLSDQQLLALTGAKPSQRPDPVRHIPTAELAADISGLAHSGYSDDHLKAIVANSNPNMPTLEDWGRSLVTGAQQGLTGMAGMLTGGQGFLRSAANAGASLGAKAVGDPTHGAATKAQFAQAQQALGQFVHDRGPNAQSLAGFGPSQQQYDQTAQHFAGPYHQPQSAGGRLAQTVGQNLSAALMPGSVVDRAMRVALPSAAGQAAYEVAPDDYKGIAKFAGSLLGGGAEGWRESMFRPPYQAVGAAMPGVSDDQLGLAQALKDKASAMGINLTNAEAMDQATGNRTDLGRLMRLAESSRVTAPRTAAFFADRPGQVDTAVRDFTGSVAPDMGPPGMVSLDAQRAAEGAQFAANRARQAAAGPAYRAADAETVDPAAIGGILDRIDEQIGGDKTGLLTPVLSKLRNSLTEAPAQGGSAFERTPTDLPGGTIFHAAEPTPGAPRVPINDIGNLSTARNYWRDFIDLPPTGTEALTKFQAGIVGDHLDSIDALLKNNANRKIGDALYAAASRQIVDPINAGPVGAIAGTTDLGAQTGALYPRNPPTGAPAETAQAVQLLNARSPGIADALTRQHLETNWNQSNRDLQSGLNQFAGAKYAKDIAGNAEQAASLRSGFDAIDPSGATGDKFDDLVEALRATGTRQPLGSKTAFNASDLTELKTPGAAVRMIGAAGDPLEWTKNIANYVGRIGGNARMKGIADILLDPDFSAMIRARDANANNLAPFFPTQATVPAAIQSPGASK